jgi:methylated-DNA-[protein]-cysteine S-methyltransferase
MRLHQAKLATPFATLGIRTQGNRLIAIDFLPRGATPKAPEDAFTARVVEEIEAYLTDPRHVFDLPLCPGGSPHQQRVWAALRGIGPGEVVTYGELARRLGSSARAVGQACGANPIPLVIPCHRVVARRGTGGFMGQREGFALAIKEWLLAHERTQ